MTRVLLALIPVTGAAVYYFGLRCLVMLAVVNIAGFSAEYFFAHYYKEKVTEAVFVSNCLFALILPPGLPYWMAVIGIVFGIIFGKMVYGGFGKNIFNPALTGRVFIYINFAVPMTGRWYSPVAGQGGGLIRYTADALTGATPMQMMKNGTDVSLIKLFLGNTSGCMGETCALFIIAGGLYLIYRKAASYQIVSSCIAAMFLLQGILHLSGIPGAIPPLRSVLGGGFLFGAFFMATDPVSACKTKPGKWVYGALIGILTVIIRTFSIWAEGVMFAVLLANMFAPVIDLTAKTIGKKAK
jgi:Na+-transporting NADH:ubiquinone oxidoreductase subunit B